VDSWGALANPVPHVESESAFHKTLDLPTRPRHKSRRTSPKPFPSLIEAGVFPPRKPGAVARSTVSDSRLGKSLRPSPPLRFESLSSTGERQTSIAEKLPFCAGHLLFSIPFSSWCEYLIQICLN
jgi:hypothetical protein